jgi:hypothetical protein
MRTRIRFRWIGILCVFAVVFYGLFAAEKWLMGNQA